MIALEPFGAFVPLLVNFEVKFLPESFPTEITLFLFDLLMNHHVRGEASRLCKRLETCLALKRSFTCMLSHVNCQRSLFGELLWATWAIPGFDSCMRFQMAAKITAGSKALFAIAASKRFVSRMLSPMNDKTTLGGKT